MEKIKSLNWQTIVIALLVISNIYFVGKVNKMSDEIYENYYEIEELKDKINQINDPSVIEENINEVKRDLLMHQAEYENQIENFELRIQNNEGMLFTHQQKINALEFELLWK